METRALLFFVSDFFYDLGKGCMLGTMAKGSSEIKEVLKEMCDYKPEKISDRLKLKIVTTVALLTAKEEP